GVRAGGGEAADPHPVRDAVCRGESVMKAPELRDMDVEALRAKTQEIDDQLFRMRIQKSMGQLEAPGKMRTIRRERARILTILKEKAK
ncbi:MAG TPA: 50S ribosomal protein L29, partial [Vicinamibacterales bacterium]|nr:50S ribosomal protein L29 [Vicinamibacterales bacterium]